MSYLIAILYEAYCPERSANMSPEKFSFGKKPITAEVIDIKGSTDHMPHIPNQTPLTLDDG